MPAGADYLQAYADGIKEVLPDMDKGYWYWAKSDLVPPAIFDSSNGSYLGNVEYAERVKHQ